MWLDCRPTNGTSSATIAIFREANTTGVRKFVIYEGDGTSTEQHVFNAGTGDVDLCKQGGELTIGGSGGAEKLTVVGGNVRLDNNYALKIKDTGGTARSAVVLDSGNGMAVGDPNIALIFYSSGSILTPVSNSDGAVGTSQYRAWVDETNHRLYFKVKYSDGTTVKSGYISLS